MRISGGELKRRVFKTPKGNDTRPTSGITRESIFNILGSCIIDTTILDLYSGCGTFGIEAISRGASFAVFTENAKIPIKCIEDNINNFGIEKKARVLKKNLPNQIDSIFMDKKPDIIFMDPPYSRGLIKKTLMKLKTSGLVTEKTIIIAEHSKEETPDSSVFELKDTRKYGKSLVSFLNNMV